MSTSSRRKLFSRCTVPQPEHSDFIPTCSLLEPRSERVNADGEAECTAQRDRGQMPRPDCMSGSVFEPADAYSKISKCSPFSHRACRSCSCASHRRQDLLNFLIEEEMGRPGIHSSDNSQTEV